MTNLQAWLSKIYQTSETAISLVALNNDASFRKYYRFTINNQTLVAVDSPPTREKYSEFIAIQNILYHNKVNVPQIYHYDAKLGYFVIEDFGNKSLLNQLQENLESPYNLYQPCIEQLINIQLCNASVVSKFNYKLPAFDQQLLDYEHGLFTEWFSTKYLNLKFTSAEVSLLNNVFNLMIANFCEQPQVLVHRDYHSRNLMLVPHNNKLSVGVIDFQDAVIGPLTYDVISLYRDCYIAWPIERVKIWSEHYFNQLCAHQIITSSISFDLFWQWFLKTSLQRNFKAIGIFSRLSLRDLKPGYLNDIPRTLNYAIEASALLSKYNHTDTQIYVELNALLLNKIKPALINVMNSTKLVIDN